MKPTINAPFTPASHAYPSHVNYADMGQRLKAERRRLHYTQEQVAEEIGVTPAFIGHIERGERSVSLDTLIRLCNFYGITIDYVLAKTLPPNEDNVTLQIRDLLKDKSETQQTALLDIMRAVVRNFP